MDKTLPVTLVETSKTLLDGIIYARKISNSQIIYCHAGEAELFSENSLPVKFKKGDIIYLSPSLLYGYIAHKAEVSMISFSGTYERLIAEYMNFNGSCIIGNCGDCEQFFSRLFNRGDNDEIETSLKLYELIVNVGIKNIDAVQKHYTVDGFLIAKITEYIADNYSKTDFKLSDAYIAAGTSRHTADSVFMLNYGMDTEEYHKFFRLENMRNLLFIRPFLNLERCAITNGFSCYEDFKKEFTEEYSITPEEFVSISEATAK